MQLVKNIWRILENIACITTGKINGKATMVVCLFQTIETFDHCKSLNRVTKFSVKNLLGNFFSWIKY